MAQNSILPKAQSRLVDQAGQPTREFYHFFNALVNNVTAQIDDLAGVIDNLANVIVALGGDPETGAGIINVAAAVEGKADSSVQILGMQSLNGGGDLTQDRFIYLDGDVETPPGVSFYGSPDGTTKGWAAFSDNFAPAMDEDDNVTLDLAEVPDAGGGILQRTAFDAYGRKTGTSAATTTDLTEGSNLYFTNARADARITAQKGVADGLAPLGSDAKINVSFLPAAVLGQVSYQGTWDASAGTPPTTTPEKGWYYIVTVAGSTELDGITDWQVGDWAIYDGATWAKVDNTDAVVTVNGYTGAVTLTAADVGAATAAQGALADTALQPGANVSTLTNDSGFLTDAPSDGSQYARQDGAWAVVSGGGGGAVDSVNGQTGTVVLDATDVGAEPAITAGTSDQYLGGDKSWQNFASSVRAAVLTGLSTATSAVIAATDTVLQAFGKLQAQLSGKADASLFDSGIYVPTVSAGTNVSAASGSNCRYIRIGSTVFVAGRVNFTCVVGGDVSMVGLSLPIASDFSSTTNMGGAGTAVGGSVRNAASMQSESSTGELGFYFAAPRAGTGSVYFSVGYDIL